MSDGLPLPSTLKFLGKPYDYQESIIDKFMKADANGLICVPCGKGKTFMALAIAFRLGSRFMVVVDKEFLLDQWAGEMRSLIPGIRVGRFQAEKMEVDPEQFAKTFRGGDKAFKIKDANKQFARWVFPVEITSRRKAESRQFAGIEFLDKADLDPLVGWL
jgi:Rad3-related DNA helicase